MILLLVTRCHPQGKHHQTCLWRQAPSPSAFYGSTNRHMDLCRGDRRISSSCGLMQNPFISLEWEPRDPFGPDRTTPLSLPAIQIKSTSGLMSAPGGRAPVLLLESNGDDGEWRVHSFLQQILSLALIVYFLHPLVSSLILYVWTNVCTTFIKFWNHMREEGFVVKWLSKIDLKYSLLNLFLQK